MAEITDLSDLLGEPRVLRLGPDDYKLPRDCPAEFYLLLLHFAEIDKPGDEEVTRLRDHALELFRVYQPEMERLPAAVSPAVLVQLVGRVYGDEEGEDPTEASQEAPGSTQKPKPKPKSKTRAASRSSKSLAS